MTDLLDRIDDKAAETVAGWDRLAVFGWACVAVGTATAVLSGGGVGALYFWGDLLTVGDLW